MLIQVLGFARPSDLFGNGEFACMFRRVWQYVASICFRSAEAFAAHTSEHAATTALQTSPLMPVTQKQQGMIGVKRTQEAIGAQLLARGLKATPTALSTRRGPFVYWTPERYNDPGLSSSTWAAETTHDVNAGCLKCGNHECRRDVCYKGRIGKQGFCRMLFWHW